MPLLGLVTEIWNAKFCNVDDGNMLYAFNSSMLCQNVSMIGFSRPCCSLNFFNSQKPTKMDIFSVSGRILVQIFGPWSESSLDLILSICLGLLMQINADCNANLTDLFLSSSANVQVCTAILARQIKI